ncbi:MAG: CDP-alcohol phosphatidyltransferase family protein [bacterium]|nr:CDP-alcohol phosphatidyltransferase family protein [bacterium]
MFSSKIKDGFRRLVQPAVALYIKLKIHPNAITLIGFLISCVSGYFYSQGSFMLGSAILILSGIHDTFDGMVARQTNKVSLFGAFFDSNMDRFNEFAVLYGIGYFFVDWGMNLFAYCTFASIFFSVMISYARARAEGLQIKCSEGLMGRVERVVFIAVISFLPLNIFQYMIILYTVLTFITVIQRIVIVKMAITNKEVK